MKFRVFLKMPDAVVNSVDEALEFVDPTPEEFGLYEDEAEEWRKSKMQQLCAIAEKWFQYGETVTIEIDTDNETATVLRSR